MYQARKLLARTNRPHSSSSPMSYSRFASNIYNKNKSIFSFLFNSNNPNKNPQIQSNSSHQYRWIFSTSHLDSAWVDKIKDVFTGTKTLPDSSPSQSSSDSFTLLRFAEELKKARQVGSLKQFVVGKGSEGMFSSAFERQEAILRVLGGYDNTGENILPSQKQEAAKRCSCTIAQVETALAKFTWAKEAQSKMEKLKAEGKPLPTSMSEVQKLMGSTAMDRARSNLAQGGQASRNAACPCGSRKRYKRCCGKD